MKYRGKLVKWRRKYAGPHLVSTRIRKYCLHSGPKAKIFLTHVDTLKAFTGSQASVSWVSSVPSPHTYEDVVEEEREESSVSGSPQKSELSGPGSTEGVVDVEPDQVTHWWLPLTV